MLPILNEIINRKRHKDSCGEQAYIICPTCKNKIDYYWSQFAGVEWAKCRTEGCFTFTKLVRKKKPKLVRRKKPKLILRRRK